VPASLPDAAGNMLGWLSPRERRDGRSVLKLRAGFHRRKRRVLPLPALRLGATGCLISVVLLAIGLFLLFALTPPPWGKE
jgi:hypothetical protein